MSTQLRRRTHFITCSSSVSSLNNLQIPQVDVQTQKIYSFGISEMNSGIKADDQKRSVQEKEVEESVENTRFFEQKYVHGVYNAIAPHFSSTRFSVRLFSYSSTNQPFPFISNSNSSMESLFVVALAACFSIPGRSAFGKRGSRCRMRKWKIFRH